MKTLLESIKGINESLNSKEKKLFKQALEDLKNQGINIKPDVKKKIETAIASLDATVELDEIREFWLIDDEIAKDLIKSWGDGITIDGMHILAVRCEGMSEAFSYNAEDDVWEEF